MPRAKYKKQPDGRYRTACNDPIVHARFLAEAYTKQSTCPFFETFYAGADDEYIQTELCKVVMHATSEDMYTFKQELIEEVKRNHSMYLGLGEGSKHSYFNHSNRVLCALQDLFIGRPDIENRIADALESPSYDKDLFHYMGSYYSVLWYGISGTYPSKPAIYALNCSHIDMINQMAEEIQKEEEQDMRKHRQLRILAILAFCLIVGIVLCLCI